MHSKDDLLDLATVQDWLHLVDVVEIAIDTAIHDLQREETRSARRRRGDGAAWYAMVKGRVGCKL